MLRSRTCAPQQASRRRQTGAPPPRRDVLTAAPWSKLPDRRLRQDIWGYPPTGAGAAAAPSPPRPGENLLCIILIQFARRLTRTSWRLCRM